MPFQQAKPFVFGASAPAPQAKPISDADRRYAAKLFTEGAFTELEVFARKLTLKHAQDGVGWKLLGAALQQLGRIGDALAPSQQAAKLLPHDAESFNNLACIQQNLGNFELAEACFRHAVALQPTYQVATVLLADVLRIQGKREESLAFYQRAQQLAPQDGYIAHHVAALSAQQTERAPAHYVAMAFDGYASTFEDHLQTTLAYHVPEQLAAMLTEHADASATPWDVLDLGCGTGLVGAALAPKAGKLVGVDLSQGMLAKAHARGIYQQLVCDDLLTMMRAEPSGSWDVITSADVFIYIGKLDEVIAEAKRLLRPRGMLAFSIETIEAARTGDAAKAQNMDYQLEVTGRYSQSEKYLNQLALDNSFAQEVMTATVLRQESGTPVPGRLVLWRA